jgi:hypothetical protein
VECYCDAAFLAGFYMLYLAGCGCICCVCLCLLLAYFESNCEYFVGFFFFTMRSFLLQG